MGASRKLQGEIDRVLKKVQEGVDVFDSIWNKVYDTDNANQKEKFEADLKKEIKKLQRYRDQIKTWIQSSEIKDKKVSAAYEQALMDARKLIEREMERFKICEKETKTKAFSKEGLGQQPKTDPKEKAKSETRDWLNNVVGELESQIDNFEAETEGLTVKKGKMKPSRLVHLELSIARHRLHIGKLETTLRLLDNDELGPEQVNEIKDFLDDYVDRNQGNFEDFDNLDDIYHSLHLDKVESHDDPVSIAPSNSKGMAIHNLKPSLVVAASQMPATSAQEQAEDLASVNSICDIVNVPRTPLAKNCSVVPSAGSSPIGSHATSFSTSISAATHLASPSARGIPEISSIANPSSPMTLASMKEEEIAGVTGHRPPTSTTDTGLVRGSGRGGLPSQTFSIAPSSSIVSMTGTLGSAPSAPEVTKRTVLEMDDRAGGSQFLQPSAFSPNKRMTVSQVGKVIDGFAIDAGNAGEAAAAVGGGKAFSPLLPTMPWRPGGSFQGLNEPGQFRQRTEIAADQKEKFLQRLHQVQLQGQNTLLMSSLAGGNHKQFSNQNSSLVQQFNSQSSPSPSLVNLGLGAQPLQALSLSPVALSSLPQQPISVHQETNTQATVPIDGGHLRFEEQLKMQPFSEDSSAPDFASASAAGKIVFNEDEKMAPYPLDTTVCGVSSCCVTESPQVMKESDISRGQPLLSNQASIGSHGVISRRNVSELCVTGDNAAGGSSMDSGQPNDQFYNLQMLEAALHKLPQPKDYECPRNYIPRNPAATPSSYPQVQAPILYNPAFWERLSCDSFGLDTLFFAFYYQQNTYQQLMAAKGLKKQSWRYHRKYNTWFQRHEEPKVATDEYEQGTYVYFDFHIAKEDIQHGWCQRIKTDFTFEYNFLEDEPIV